MPRDGTKMSETFGELNLVTSFLEIFEFVRPFLASTRSLLNPTKLLVLRPDFEGSKVTCTRARLSQANLRLGFVVRNYSIVLIC